MADIELVIKIPKDAYEATCNGHMLPPDVENVVNAIKQGTPLPEHHGGLIDYDDLIAKLDRYGRGNVKYQLPYSPTIIERSDNDADSD